MAGYHSLIIAHGVIAAIVFLGLVPLSILIIRYYSRWNPFWAFKLHAWFQVLTLLLTTVVFVLGWFAVGPERSLTNPHHGIGLAIYVMVIFQVLWGWLVHKIESKRKRYHVPLKLVVCPCWVSQCPLVQELTVASDTSVAWSCPRSSRNHSDPFRTHSLRFAKVAFYSLCTRCLRIFDRALHTFIPLR